MKEDSEQSMLVSAEADETNADQSDALETEITVTQTSSEDPDLEKRLNNIKWALMPKVGEEFAVRLGRIIRDAVDYVIDASVMRRYALSELEPDEKTTIGKRIERLMRIEFGLPKGKEKLDVHLAGEDVDIKTSCTTSRSWMFARSNVNHVNILIAYDEEKAIYDLGLILVTDDILGKDNRDQKRGLSIDKGRRKTQPGLKGAAEEAKGQITWLLRDQPYPANFLAHLPPGDLEFILKSKTGMGRVRNLLKRVTGRPIPRHAIAAVANQKDPMRRTRQGGGARDLWKKDGLVVLSGSYLHDREIAQAILGIQLADDETASFLRSDPRMTPELLTKYAQAHGLDP